MSLRRGGESVSVMIVGRSGMKTKVLYEFLC